VFKWEHPASEVYVTGTFDNWSKSEKLIKTGDVFEKNVTLPSAAEKIYYKKVLLECGRDSRLSRRRQACEPDRKSSLLP